VDLEKIAYDFEYEIDHKVSPGLYEELTQLVRDWRQRHASADKPFLYYSKSLSYVTVYDGRPSDRPMRMRYDWPASSIIEQCNEAPKSKEQIQAGLKETGRGEVPDPASVENLLAALVARRILYAERGKYFTLALPTNATF
ncbi:MAG: RiPP maturation radical SAM protein 1, partial [Nitrospirota bacterium]|nr:RiPP maturation radical SAM protein 1 [Nitrospirota bacterium]